MFELLGAALAVAAFIFSRKAIGQIGELREKIQQLEARLDGKPVAAASTIAATSPAPSDVAPPLAPTVIETPRPMTPPPAAPRPTAPSVAAATASRDETKTADGPGFEERLGTRWVVWLGGLTLALGGLFLVRYSIEEGLIGPGMRVFLGALFAAALLGAGEWTRRKESLSTIAALPIANIPAILTAAGTTVAFGTIYAAYALYDFLNPGIAFIMLGIVALSTLAAALLHGPALAGLGLVAAFVTPVLVSSNEPNFWALYTYLAVVTAAAFMLARARLWRWLAITAIALGFLWLLPELDEVNYLAPHAFHIIASFALAAALVVAGFLFGPDIERGRVEPVSSGAVIAWLFGVTLLVVPHIQDTAALAVFTLVVVGALAVAWKAEAATAAVPAAGIFVAIMFASWFVQTTPDYTMVPSSVVPGLAPNPTDASTTQHFILGIAFALLFGASGFLAQARAGSARIAILWSAAGTLTPLLILIALYARIAHLDRSIPFALGALALAAAFAYAAEQLIRRPARAGQQIAIAFYATGALAALALGLTFALEKGWLTVALALMAPAAAWVSTQRPVPFLRWLAGGLAVLVSVRLGWDPRIAGSDLGTTPVFNWLLWGYGVPAASFAVAGILMRRQADDAPTRMAEAGAILFTTLLVFLQIRHFMTGGDIYRGYSHLAEMGAQVCAFLAMALGMERIRARTGSIVHNIGAVVLTVLAGIIAVLCLLYGLMMLIFAMPRDAVDGTFFNVLLLGYAMPAVLAIILSRYIAGRRRAGYANTIAAGSLVLAFAYITLQVRRVYHGPILATGVTTNAEQYTYSVAWLGFGVALLLAGVFMQSQRARLASAVVIGLTILKAFFIDMGDLTGVWRALSFIGLGLVLVAIGFLYQKILFRRAPSAPVEADNASR